MALPEEATAWLRERHRPGNWYDIAVDEPIHPDISGWSLSIVNLHQMAFAPEIRKREQAGELPSDFLLWGAQLIQPFEGGREIRLNAEVRGKPFLRVGRPVEKGEEVKLADLEHMEVFDLEEDELDSGHFTIFWTGKSWVGSFDFRSGRAKCAGLLEKAESFLAASRLSSKAGKVEPAIDNLHTSCELAAKARLMLLNREAFKWKSHGPIASGINRESRMGNVDSAFVELFNRLGQIRNHAKYATGFEGQSPSQDDFELVGSMIVSLKESVRPKIPAQK